MPLTPAQNKIITALDGDTANVDDLCERSALPASVVMAELTLLQIRGLIQRLPGNRFTRAHIAPGLPGETTRSQKTTQKRS